MSRASTLAKAVGPNGDIAVSGNTTIGDASTDTVTFNAATASIPNNLNFSGGNVGIGITTPGTLLHVNKATASDTEFRISNAQDANYIAIGKQGNAAFGQTAVGNGYIYTASDWSMMSNGGAIKFATGGSAEKMRIDSSGNVGIGTNSPVNPLTISGSTTLSIGGGYWWNGYYNSGYKYWQAGPAGYVTLDNSSGAIVFASTASAGTAGAAATVNERMRIDTGGNIGIGVTPSPNSLAASGYKALELGNYAGSGLYCGGLEAYVNANVYYNSGFKYAATGAAAQYALSGGNHVWFVNASGTAGTAVSTTPAMKLDTSGTLLVGCTSIPNVGATPAQWGFSVSPTEVVIAKNTNSTALWIKNLGGTSTAINFYNGQTQVGSVTTTSATTSYNPSSDARLKENITPITNGVARVMKLKPVDYNWKANGVLDNGFIAQDLLAEPEFEIRVNAVGKAEDGSDLYGVDYMKFVAVLAAAIQEQQAIIEGMAAKLKDAGVAGF